MLVPGADVGAGVGLGLAVGVGVRPGLGVEAGLKLFDNGLDGLAVVAVHGGGLNRLRGGGLVGGRRVLQVRQVGLQLGRQLREHLGDVDEREGQLHNRLAGILFLSLHVVAVVPAGHERGQRVRGVLLDLRGELRDLLAVSAVQRGGFDLLRGRCAVGGGCVLEGRQIGLQVGRKAREELSVAGEGGGDVLRLLTDVVTLGEIGAELALQGHQERAREAGDRVPCR
ncbi:MAG TPA: hypothetical protein DCP11_05010 [Microbacteriaceae bacterium]|nr:hypothetical protein [Microbacteriaceae bacterium]